MKKVKALLASVLCLSLCAMSSQMYVSAVDFSFELSPEYEEILKQCTDENKETLENLSISDELKEQLLASPYQTNVSDWLNNVQYIPQEEAEAYLKAKFPSEYKLAEQAFADKYVLPEETLYELPDGAEKVKSARHNLIEHFTAPFSLETDTFAYTCDEKGAVTLESHIDALQDLDDTFLVTGVFYSGDETTPAFYTISDLDTLSVFNQNYVLPASSIEMFLSDAPLALGDVISSNSGKVSGVGLSRTFQLCTGLPIMYIDYITEKVVQRDGEEDIQYCYEAPDVEYLGNAVDIFGDEFTKVLRHTSFFNAEDYFFCMDDIHSDISGLDAVKGDATEDENVNIVDVIAVNKNVLGKEKMSAYAQYVSDINQNNVVDAGDSLEILKYVVGLNETL